MKKKIENEQFFATSMDDMGGNRGETPENDILWDLCAEGKKHKGKSDK